MCFNAKVCQFDIRSAYKSNPPYAFLRTQPTNLFHRSSRLYLASLTGLCSNFDGDDDRISGYLVANSNE